MKNNILSKMVKTIILATAVMTISLPVMASGGKGMTWGFRGYSIPANNSATTPYQNPKAGYKKNVYVGCNSGGTMCNAYKGETSCSAKRHILCMKVSGNLKRPPYKVTTGSNAMKKEAYSGWSPKKIRLGPKVQGTNLSSLAVANRLCGTGWRMAEFHDGFWIKNMSKTKHHKSSTPVWNLAKAKRGGWAFHAKFVRNNNLQGNFKKQIRTLKNERYWVHINDTKGNCWN